MYPILSYPTLNTSLTSECHTFRNAAKDISNAHSTARFAHVVLCTRCGSQQLLAFFMPSPLQCWTLQHTCRKANSLMNANSCSTNTRHMHMLMSHDEHPQDVQTQLGTPTTAPNKLSNMQPLLPMSHGTHLLNLQHIDACLQKRKDHT